MTELSEMHKFGKYKQEDEKFKVILSYVIILGGDWATQGTLPQNQTKKQRTAVNTESGLLRVVCFLKRSESTDTDPLDVQPIGDPRLKQENKRANSHHHSVFQWLETKAQNQHLGKCS